MLVKVRIKWVAWVEKTLTLWVCIFDGRDVLHWVYLIGVLILAGWIASVKDLSAVCY